MASSSNNTYDAFTFPNELVHKARRYCEKLLMGKIPSYLKFHNLAHTSEVVSSVQILAQNCDLSIEELELVTLAAWFHDTGYSISTVNHEEASCNLARRFLRRNGYELGKTRRLEDCILATKLPQNPKGLVQQVLCDADMAHLALPFYWVKNGCLRTELEITLERGFSDHQWYSQNLLFMQTHEYLTEYARNELTMFKQVNTTINRQLVAKIKAGSSLVGSPG